MKPGRTPGILRGFVERVFLVSALALLASAIVLMRFAFRLSKHLDYPITLPRRTRLGNDSNALLLLRFLRRARSSWQLQHSRVLTLTETGEQHNLPTRKLKRVVMHVRLVLLNLAEPSHFFRELFHGLHDREETKSVLALDLFLERDLRAGKKAHGYVWFSDRGKTTSDRVAEFRRH